MYNVWRIVRDQNGINFFVNPPFLTDNDDPPYFKMKFNPLDSGPQTLPAMLKATAGDAIMCTNGDLAIVNNCAVWDLFTDADVITYINSVYSTIQAGQLIIDVYNDTVESPDHLVQTIVIPVIPDHPLNPLLE